MQNRMVGWGHDVARWSLVSAVGTLLALQLLELVFLADELVDLIDEVRLRFSDDGLNFVDLLIDNLVDFLHMVKHVVGFLIKQVKLRLIALQL